MQRDKATLQAFVRREALFALCEERDRALAFALWAEGAGRDGTAWAAREIEKEAVEKLLEEKARG